MSKSSQEKIARKEKERKKENSKGKKYVIKSKMILQVTECS